MSHVKVGRQMRREKVAREYLGLRKQKRGQHRKIVKIS
jgi:hypothetical protein